MSESLSIGSHNGPYSVFFDDDLLARPGLLLEGEPHFLVDSNIARLYSAQIQPVLSHRRTVVIEATEENKSIERVIPIFERLVVNRARRDHVLVAIGGGIIQDITSFVASTLLRGMSWRFVPTTLLAQADSCIGSKSSINLGRTKNILGTFNPPREVFVSTGFLDSLEDKDIRSGIGEILKVHAIESAASYDRVAADYDALIGNRKVLLAYIKSALRIKQRYIEVDEFDRGIRNIFNYGHSFGHAIESVSGYGVPHGIAVTMGMDMANRIAALRGLLPERHCNRMRQTLRRNRGPFRADQLSVDEILSALLKDKKNIGDRLVLIFPVGDEAKIERVEVIPDETFRRQCSQALGELNG